MQIGQFAEIVSGPYTGKVGEIVRITHASAGTIILWLAVTTGNMVSDHAVLSSHVRFYAH
jgi:hypothetical protein